MLLDLNANPLQEPVELQGLRVVRPLPRHRLFRRLLDVVETFAADDVRGDQPARDDDDVFDDGRRSADGGAAAQRAVKPPFGPLRVFQR